MTRTKRLRIAMLSVAAAAQVAAASAQGQDLCKKSCQHTDLNAEDKKGAYVELDGNTGELISGSDSFSSGVKSVRVFVRRPNPFKYEYRVRIKNQRTEAQLVLDFLGLIPGFSDKISALSSRAPVKTAASECTGDDLVPASQLRATNERLQKQSQALKERLADPAKTSDSALKDMKTFIAAVDKEAVDCATACASAAEFMPKLKPVELATLPDDVSAFKSGASEFATALAAFAPKSPMCKKEIDSTLVPAGTQLTKDATAYVDVVKAVQDTNKQGSTLATLLKTVLAENDAFLYSELVQTGRGARAVTVHIERRNRLAGETAYVALNAEDFEFTVGESPISLSAGVAWSSVDDVKFTRQSSLVPDGKGGTKLGSVFGYETNSKFKPSPVLFLNAHWPTNIANSGVDLATSVGLALKGDRTTSEVEYILGESFRVLDSNLFLTVGFHAAPLLSLAGGFAVNDPIPSDLPDPLPTEKRWQWGLVFSVSYKVR